MGARSIVSGCVALCLFVLTVACGGHPRGSTAPIVDETSPVTPALGHATARVHVNVTSGKVTVTPLLPASRAVLGGSAVTLNAGPLTQQPGGVRSTNVSLTNDAGVLVGQAPDGTVSGIRVLVDLLRGTGSLDLRSQSRVRTAWQSSLSVYQVLDPEPETYGTDSLANTICRSDGSSVLVGGGAGFDDGSAAFGTFSSPAGLAWNALTDALIVADRGNDAIRRVTREGDVNTIAGAGFPGDADGAGQSALFREPVGVAVGPDGAIYVTEADGNRVRRITLTPGADPFLADSYVVALLAGSPTGAPGYVNGRGRASRFDMPMGVSVGADGAVYVSDQGNRRIRRATATGEVTTIAGTGASGHADGPGDAATFEAPAGCCWTEAGLAVSEPQMVRLVTPKLGADPARAANWVVRSLAGTGVQGHADGPGTAAVFNSLRMISGTARALWVADYGNRTACVISPSAGEYQIGTAQGVTVANADGQLPGDGGPWPYFQYSASLPQGATSGERQWSFNVPAEVTEFDLLVTVDAATTAATPPAAGTAFSGSRLAMVRTLAGAAGSGAQDGPGDSARFNSPLGIDIDGDGALFVADGGNGAVRRVARDGSVRTIRSGLAGLSALACEADGRALWLINSNRVQRLELGSQGSPEVPGDWSLVGTGIQAADNERFYDIAVSAAGDVYLGIGAGVGIYQSPDADGGAQADLRLYSRDGQPVGPGTGLLPPTTAWQEFYGDPFSPEPRYATGFDGINVQPSGGVVFGQWDFWNVPGPGMGLTSLRATRLPPAGAATSLTGWQHAADEMVAAWGGSISAPASLSVLDVEPSGNVIVAIDHAVARISPPQSGYGVIAGDLVVGGLADGPGASARFESITGGAIGPGGEVYVLDGNRIRLIQSLLTNP